MATLLIDKRNVQLKIRSSGGNKLMYAENVTGLPANTGACRDLCAEFYRYEGDPPILTDVKIRLRFDNLFWGNWSEYDFIPGDPASHIFYVDRWISSWLMGSGPPYDCDNVHRQMGWVAHHAVYGTFAKLSSLTTSGWSDSAHTTYFSMTDPSGDYVPVTTAPDGSGDMVEIQVQQISYNTTNPVDATIVTVIGPLGNTVFEFDDDGSVTPGNIQVLIGVDTATSWTNMSNAIKGYVVGALIDTTIRHVNIYVAGSAVTVSTTVGGAVVAAIPYPDYPNKITITDPCACVNKLPEIPNKYTVTFTGTVCGPTDPIVIEQFVELEGGYPARSCEWSKITDCTELTGGEVGLDIVSVIYNNVEGAFVLTLICWPDADPDNSYTYRFKQHAPILTDGTCSGSAMVGAYDFLDCYNYYGECGVGSTVIIAAFVPPFAPSPTASTPKATPSVSPTPRPMSMTFEEVEQKINALPSGELEDMLKTQLKSRKGVLALHTEWRPCRVKRTKTDLVDMYRHYLDKKQQT